jgi:hypothetical protein
VTEAMMLDRIVEVFCGVDDFCTAFLLLLCHKIMPI